MKYLCILIALLAPQAYASKFYTAERANEPDHLVPLDYPSSNYDKLITERLCSSGGFATYIVRPSFSAESCLTVYEEISKEAEKKHGGWWIVPNEEKKYFIVVKQASPSLWYSMAENNDEKKDKAVDISETTREISLELAIAIQRAWVKMLLRTHYSRGSTLGLDGTTLQFSAWAKGLGSLHGETWSPKSGPTAELAALGNALIEFTENKGSEERPLIQRLQAFEARTAN